MSKKSILVLLCVFALVAASVFGTLAYLTDTDDATNTFTVGDVQITLDEQDVDDSDKDQETTDRDKANEYHLLPGLTYVKDPTVHIKPKSEASYVRMIVTVEGIENLKNAIEEYVDDNGVFLLQNLTIDEDGNMTWDNVNWPIHSATADGVYEFRYKDIVAKNEADIDRDLEALFTRITVPGELVDNDELALLKTVKIKVEAHAIQAAGFDDADAAWGAFDTQNP